MDKSPWQQEFDALPDWARRLIDAMRRCKGYGGGESEGLLGESTKVFFRERREATEFMLAISGASEFAKSLSAPWPPPAAPLRERRAFNIVELAADSVGDETAFDQPCAFGSHVKGHAVYCHNEAWPDSPRKCRRNRTDYPHETCPGFVRNPDWQSDH